MVSNRRLLVFVPVAMSATSLLVFAGTGLHPLWLLTWLAPIPMLLLAPRVSAKVAFLAASISWFAGSLNMWHYLRDVLQIPIGVVLAAQLLPSCVFAVIVLVYRYFARRGAKWAAALSMPVLWVAYEYLSSVVSPHGTFANLAYTQMDFLPLLQIASVTGPWGISFCLFLLPASIAVSVVSSGSNAGRRIPAIVACGVLCAAVLWGTGRLHSGTPGSHTRVGLIASDLPVNRFPQKDADTLRLLREYANATSLLPAAPGAAGVVVLPEKIGVLSEGAVSEADAIFRQAAERSRAMMLVGLDRGTAKRRANEGRLYSADGRLLGVYAKHHMIPGLEDVDVPGTSRVVMRQSSGAWGVTICKDMDFPALSREYGRDGVGLLLVPAWDFEIDGWLHSRMAIMRGVESGFTIARSAKQGLLTVSDNRGRILAEKSSAEGPFSFLTIDAPVNHAGTIYVRWGDWFAWLNLAVAAVILLALVYLRTRSRVTNLSDMQ